jgi:PhnB protein
MAVVKPIPEGYHSVTPFLSARNVTTFIEFLKQAFDAKQQGFDDLGGGHIHAEVDIGDSRIMISQSSEGAAPMPSALHLYVRDVEGVYERALEAGATSMYEPAVQDYGHRQAGLKDGCGNDWYVTTHIDRGAREYLPEGQHSVTPSFHVAGAAKMIDFLKSAFAAEEIFRVGDGDVVDHAKIRIGDSIIELSEAQGQWGPRPMQTYLYVNDADVTYASALDAGATSVIELLDVPWGDRNGGVKDPFGNTWFIATHKEDVSPEELARRFAARAKQ